ncbi:hypothetical protein U4I66_07815 [Stenotrophomonas maltophilia]|uniref:hypothetical protein n=1 Tax=Stenotrophomonas maltophilia TaxID=40324 RepID=UPI002ACC76B7|nr:hypothetical protein [Stenotrophomonas maltophilia]MDZ5841743.1 hypothetical protein [Stenotrophomonas maltophilia]
MDLIAQLIAGVALAVAAVVAFRQYRRARLIPYARALQRSTLAISSDIMANPQNSLKVRTFAKTIALMAMSNAMVSSLSRDRKRIQDGVDAAEYGGPGDAENALSDEEKVIVQPLLHVFAMTCLLYDPQYSSQIKTLWESAMAEAVARASSPQPSHPKARKPMVAVRTAAPSKPVEEKIIRVEDEILERVSGYCVA